MCVECVVWRSAWPLDPITRILTRGWKPRAERFSSRLKVVSGSELNWLVHQTQRKRKQQTDMEAADPQWRPLKAAGGTWRWCFSLSGCLLKQTFNTLTSWCLCKQCRWSDSRSFVRLIFISFPHLPPSSHVPSHQLSLVHRDGGWGHRCRKAFLLSLVPFQVRSGRIRQDYQLFFFSVLLRGSDEVRGGDLTSPASRRSIATVSWFLWSQINRDTAAMCLTRTQSTRICVKTCASAPSVVVSPSCQLCVCVWLILLWVPSRPILTPVFLPISVSLWLWARGKDVRMRRGN